MDRVGEGRSGRSSAYIATNAPHAPLQVPPEVRKAVRRQGSGRTSAKFFGMIANIDDNVGRLLAKLKEWDIERDTLVIFMNDNGGTDGVEVLNAGMRGGKVHALAGRHAGGLVLALARTLKPADVDRLDRPYRLLPHAGRNRRGKDAADVAAKSKAGAWSRC